MSRILKANSTGWKKFCRLLEGKEGCDFKEDKDKEITWKCKGGNDKSKAKNILKKYFPDVDITKTIQYFESKGGHCDCEILFNVDR